MVAHFLLLFYLGITCRILDQSTRFLFVSSRFTMNQKNAARDVESPSIGQLTTCVVVALLLVCFTFNT